MWQVRMGVVSLVCVMFASVFPTAAMASSTPVLDRIRETGVVRIAHRDASIPFSYLDTDKKPIGYAIDLCSRVVERVRVALKRPDLKVEYMVVTPATREQAIATGKADLECGSTTNTRERREKVSFTIAHYLASSRMLVKTSSGIRKWDDLRGKTVVSTQRSTNVAQLRKLDDASILNLRIVETKDQLEAFSMVESGKADAFVLDDVLLYGFRASAKHPSDYMVVGEPLVVEANAIMLSRDDAEFKHVVDLAMANLILDGDADKLYRKWFQQPIPPNGMKLDIPMSYLLRDSFKYPTDKVNDY